LTKQHIVLSLIRRTHTTSSLFPYTTLFRSRKLEKAGSRPTGVEGRCKPFSFPENRGRHTSTGNRRMMIASLASSRTNWNARGARSEEHTSELQSRFDLVCRLLLEKKNGHYF